MKNIARNRSKKASHQQANDHHKKEQDTTQLLLIRHGLTDWVGHRLPGWTPGIHLSEEGRQQAMDQSAEQVERSRAREDTAVHHVDGHDDGHGRQAHQKPGLPDPGALLKGRDAIDAGQGSEEIEDDQVQAAADHEPRRHSKEYSKDDRHVSVDDESHEHRASTKWQAVVVRGKSYKDDDYTF